MKGGVRGWLFTFTEIITDIMELMLCEATKCSIIVYLLSSFYTWEEDSPSRTLHVDMVFGLFKGLKGKGFRFLKHMHKVFLVH